MSDPASSTWGKWFSERQDELELNNAEMGRRIGVSGEMVRKYREGARPNSSKLAPIAEVFGVSQPDLLAVLDGRPTGVSGMGSDEAVSTLPVETARLPELYHEAFELRVYTHVPASAGKGLFGWEPNEEEIIRLQRSRRLFAELFGFWPPDDLEGIRVEGWSMKKPNGGGIEHGQIIFYRPVHSRHDVESGFRYVLTVDDGEGPRLLVKRVQFFTGGGIKIISDNPGAGVSDEILLPHEEGLINQLTQRIARINIVGRVLWPSDRDDEATIRAVNAAIENLIARGYLPAAA